ncbi:MULTISPECIES: sugar transferase [unclassified Ruminococcus]|uniref:sugar transferase n=1 Tax=unclassified Ruminococcus TaxID=2608920 RepID=UPI00210E32D6|nr:MULTISPECIES: sugar transferase [unclassified Ruminococcus]MCQ4022670.1 sugar transferase [Ruminococcus sp. zg-924]MCQ4114910.1 sugar transferase [Ruminococcus sp. zg-921]
MVKWQRLPLYMKTPQVEEYYNILQKKRVSLLLKRIIDIVLSLILIAVLLIPMAVIAVVVKSTSSGPVIFKQIRITTGAREFKIFKFRTMVDKQDKDSSQVTVNNDSRVTKCGGFLRKYRLDELPQLFNVLLGQMSFVGTRPEVPKYVKAYTPEMYATLLMPAGITSLASITYKDENKFLTSGNADDNYINILLPKKMEFNLEYIKKFSVLLDIKIMIKTVIGVVRD